MKYRKSGNQEERFDEEWYLEKLALAREEDSRFCHTSVGPHRDDLIFLMNGNDISSYGSQGQQRTAILSMKLAELEFVKKETGEYPLLLLDDVGSELDKERRNTLFSYLTKKEIQTIITTTDESLGAYGKEIKIESFLYLENLKLCFLKCCLKMVGMLIWCLIPLIIITINAGKYSIYIWIIDCCIIFALIVKISLEYHKFCNIKRQLNLQKKNKNGFVNY